ncbi:MAG: hypothetical protein WBL74_07745 [Novosphingobium sp.]
MVQVFELLKGHSKRFIPVLLRVGGHPGMVGGKGGGYNDAWNTDPDPGIAAACQRRAIQSTAMNHKSK